jgi:hypothetical protein
MFAFDQDILAAGKDMHPHVCVDMHVDVQGCWSSGTAGVVCLCVHHPAYTYAQHQFLLKAARKRTKTPTTSVTAHNWLNTI